MANIRNWKTALLLSLIVPMGLVVSLRTANLAHGPLQVSETITLDTIKWQHETLCGYIFLGETVEGHYTGDIMINQSILVGDFLDMNYAFGGSSSVTLSLNLTAEVNTGYVEDMYLSLEEGYEYARMYLWEEPGFMKTEALSAMNYTVFSKKIFVDLRGVDHPKKVSFCAPVDWAFYSSYSQTHEVMVSSEITYYNGTVYKKVVQPFLLRFVPDSNTRDTAVRITSGKYSGLFLGGENVADFYVIHLVQGQRVHVEVNDTQYGNCAPYFRVYVYDPTDNAMVFAEDPGTPLLTYKSFDFNATASGDWYIEVRKVDWYGFYTLEVDVQ